MRAAILVAAVLLVAGCGETGATTHSKAGKSRPTEHRTCGHQREDQGGAVPGFRTCFSASEADSRATIERRTGSEWTVVAGPLKPRDPSTAWGDLWLSPDGGTLLAEWLYACDGHMAVFVPLHGGKPRIVTGERSWTDAVASLPLGWTTGGKARVRVLRRWGPRSEHHAGVYLFDPGATGGPARNTRGRLLGR